MLVICGGDTDPNLRRLLDRARERKIKCLPALVGADTNPSVRWDVNDDCLWWNRRRIRPAAAFIRYDVFTNLSDQRAQSAYRANCWYTLLASWIESHPEVVSFNRSFRGQILKPSLLHLAQKCGLPIPVSWITNDMDFLRKECRQKPLVVKPVNGGDYCQELLPLLKQTPEKGGAAAAPSIVQHRLVPPEVRIFRVGDEFISFQVKAEALDYRTASNCKVEMFHQVDSSTLDGLRQLTDHLGMDFMAADFKACPESGRLLFLEVNSSPMFAGFDAAANGALCDAFLNYLVG